MFVHYKVISGIFSLIGIYFKERTHQQTLQNKKLCSKLPDVSPFLLPSPQQ